MADINDILQKELLQRRAQNIFAPTEKSVTRGDIPKGVQLPNISIDGTSEGALLNAEYGPRQVQSLLALIVDFPLHYRLEEAVHYANRLVNNRHG